MDQIHQEIRNRITGDWEHFFTEPNQLPQLHLSIHGVELSIGCKNKNLLAELKAFFPIEWQGEVIRPIQIDWIAPPLSKNDLINWDQKFDPDCQFIEDFVSQRDFLAKKVSDRHYQLMAHEKIDDGLFNFLRFLIPTSLLEKKRVLFHSSCVVDNNGEAYLFFGPSGAGKSTISELCGSQGGLVLGDDMNILHIHHKHIRVEGGAVGQRYFDKNNFGKTFPLKRAFWLRKGSENSHFVMSTGKRQIFLSSFANFFWDQLSPIQYNKIFQLNNQLVNQIKLYQLSFKKDPEVWNYVRSIK